MGEDVCRGGKIAVTHPLLNLLEGHAVVKKDNAASSGRPARPQRHSRRARNCSSSRRRRKFESALFFQKDTDGLVLRLAMLNNKFRSSRLPVPKRQYAVGVVDDL